MLELTILMPCLNEAETLAACIDKAKGFLARSGIKGEVLISDNGSTSAWRAGGSCTAPGQRDRAVDRDRGGKGPLCHHGRQRRQL